jgi:hypothetical protein
MRRATDGNQAGIGDEVRGLFRNQDGADADQVLPQHRLRGKRGLSPSGLRPVPLVVDQVFADRRDGQVHIPDPPHLAFLKRAKGRRCCCWWRAVLHLPMMSVKADRGNCATTVPLSRRRAPPGWATYHNGQPDHAHRPADLRRPGPGRVLAGCPGREWVCTTAGTPDTWIQTLPAAVMADPSTGMNLAGHLIASAALLKLVSRPPALPLALCLMATSRFDDQDIVGCAFVWLGV